MPNLTLVKTPRKPQPGDEKVVKGVRYVYSARARRYVLLSIDVVRVRDVLGLVMEKLPPANAIGTWSFQDRWRALWWALREHLRASDNHLPRVPVPKVLLPFLHPATRDSVKVWA